MSKKITSKNIPKRKIDDSEQARPHIKRKSSRKIANIALIAGIAILVILGGLLIYVNSASVNIDEKSPGFLRMLANFNSKLFPRQEKPLAVVNGEAITKAELDEKYNLLVPKAYQGFVPKEQVLNFLIDQTILLQQAGKEGINASNEEVDSMIQSLLDKNGMTEQDLTQVLGERNLTLQSLRESIRQDLIQEKLLNRTALKDFSVSESDIDNYYINNREMFILPERVNVSHILICHNDSQMCTSNLTKEEALAKAKKVRALINSTNFGEIAVKYSDDPSAAQNKGNLPGSIVPGYVTREDGYDETFLNATFALKKGQVSDPVETVFGYHLIKVYDRLNESTVDLDAVRDQINDTLLKEGQQKLISEYVSGLKNSSQIATFNVTG